MNSTLVVDGKKIAVVVDKLDPQVEVSEKANSKNQVVQTYLDYNRLLAAGKISEASKLSHSPEATLKQQTAYQERLGGLEAYKKQMQSVLTSGLKLTHVIEKDGYKMLLGVHPKHGAFSNFFNCSKDKCLLTDNMSVSAVQELASIFGQVRENKIKL